MIAMLPSGGVEQGVAIIFAILLLWYAIAFWLD
jgi:hypothetical protein